MSKNIAYVRVSTIMQNEERQLEILKDYNIDKYFTEKVSAKDTVRPKLIEMLEFIREDDVIYVTDFSRLARNVKDLLNIVATIEEKGATLISLKENLDTKTPTSKLMLTVIGAINEFEREILLERQREGIALAKAKGKYKGRKKTEYPENWKELYDKWRIREIKTAEFMEKSGLKHTTFYVLRREYEKELKEKQEKQNDKE